MSARISRKAWAEMYGPTAGDRIRLADTDLWIRVETDLTVPGDECKFGGGKSIRDGQGQSSRARQGDALDLVITNVVVLDVDGIRKADVGVRHGRVAGVGKAVGYTLTGGSGQLIGSLTGSEES